MIEAICFDMDGILFDTERLSVESWIAVAEKLGLGNIEKGVYGCIGLNRTDCRIFLKEVYGEDFPYDYLREQTSALFQERVEKEGLPVMKGAGGAPDLAAGKRCKDRPGLLHRTGKGAQPSAQSGFYGLFPGGNRRGYGGAQQASS